MRSIFFLLLVLPSFSTSFFQTDMKIYSSSDWTIISFKNARIAYCEGNQPGIKFRCYPDYIYMTQGAEGGTSGEFHLYLYNVVQPVRIKIQKGYIGKVLLIFSYNEEKTTIENDEHTGELNPRDFTISLPGRVITREKHIYIKKPVLGYYYTWYGNPAGPAGRWRHWNLCGHNPDAGDLNSAHFPLLGPYDSASTSVIQQHILWAQQAGIDGFIIPWFGRNTYSALATEVFAREALRKNFKFSLSFPFTDYPESIPPEEAAKEIIFSLSKYSKLPIYLKINNKPVIFFFSADQIDLSFWKKVLRTVRKAGFNPFTMAHSRDSTTLQAFSGIYFYLPIFSGEANGEIQKKYFSWAHHASVLKNSPLFLPIYPGFDKRRGCDGQTLYVPRNGGETMQRLYALLMSYHPDGLLISTFNEWHEGTEVEPSREFGFFYLDLVSILTRVFKSHEKIRR